MRPFEDPLRRCLRVVEWPERDRNAWELALAPGDLLEGTVGAGHHWCEDTREKHRKDYGRWLTFIIASGRYDREAAPVAEVVPDAVREYLQILETQVASWTIWGRLAGLTAVARAFAPEKDWRWLDRIMRRLESRTSDLRAKHPRLRPAKEIFDWARRRLREIEHDPPKRDAPSAYRDALMIGLLISCPTMRLRNLTQIEIGTHLVEMSDGWELRFRGTEMKARKPVEIPVPRQLSPFLERYISEVRPGLLGEKYSERLWITRYGCPMTKKSVHARITTVTKRAFGRPINPHLFRDCAATTVALDDPKHVRIAAPILGHTDPRTTERHYIQAQQIDAGRKLQASLRALRRDLRPAHSSSFNQLER